VEIRGEGKLAWPKNTLENTSLNEPEPIDRTRYESTAGALRAIRVLGSISLSIATHLTVCEFLRVSIMTAISADVTCLH